MARARNIKPALFANDVLAEIEPIGRLLFIGLWTICDYKGNLEYRPNKVKAGLLPYDDCNVKQLSINLELSGFIQSYSNNGVIYINITNFTKHQNPHKNERDKGSEVPCLTDEQSQLYDLKEDRIKSENIAINPDNNGTNRADSLILIPDSLSLIPSCEDSSVKPAAKPSKYKFNQYQMDFAKWMHSLILKVNPTFADPNLDDWANTLRLMIDVNKRDGDHMVEVFTWANGDSFWSSNIQSPTKFRKQFDALTAKMNGNSKQSQSTERTQVEVDQFTNELNDQYERSQAAKARREAREL